MRGREQHSTRAYRVTYADPVNWYGTEVGGERGYDGGKGISGRKRHLVVDSLGLLMAVLVTAAAADDGTTAPHLLGQLNRHRFPRLEVVWGDGKYRNDDLDAWPARSRARSRVKVVKRPEGTVGFVKLPKRWVSERTFAWRGRDRRHSKDYEWRPESSEAWVRVSARRRTRSGGKLHLCTSDRPPPSFPDSLSESVP